MQDCLADDDMLTAVLSMLPAAILRAAAPTCRRWREMVPVAAEGRVRHLHQGVYPAGHDTSPCWLRSLFTVELIEDAVGPRPPRSWQEEYVELHVQAEKKRWRPELHGPWHDAMDMKREEYETGLFSLASMIREDGRGRDKRGRSALTDLEAAGFSADEARLLTFQIAGEEEGQVLNDSYLHRRNDFAATTHAQAIAYTRAAARMLRPAPQAYNTVRSLTEFSSEWAALPRRQVGESFFCMGGSPAREAWDCYFPNSHGMHVEECVPVSDTAGEDYLRDWQTIYVLDDSPVVLFLSSAADRNGFHSLVQDAIGAWDSAMGPKGEYEPPSWSVPMATTVTLVEVHAPGEWEVYPYKPGLRPARKAVRPQQSLYTVRVSFG